MSLLPTFLVFASSLSLSMTIPSQTIPIGSEFRVIVNINTENRQTIGADAVLIYDPKMMTAVRVNPGKIYPYYPQNLMEIDNVLGRLSFSGTVGFGKTQTANGLLGEVYFLAQRPGTAHLDFAWKANETKNSNIVPEFGELNLLKNPPPGAVLTFRQPSFWEGILIKLQRIFSFEYLRV